MIFQLSKNKTVLTKSEKSDGQRPVEAETLQRWRELSKNDSPDDSEGVSAPLRTSEPELKWSDQFAEEASRSSEKAVMGGSPAWSFEDSLESWRGPAGTKNIDETVSEKGVIKMNPEPEIRSALGPGTVIEGKLRFDSPVRIDGNLIGEVTSSSTLVVGEQAVVKAIVQVGTLVVLGQVTGQVQATEKVQIKDGGILEANVKTRELVIDNGGFFRGGCNN